MRMTEKVTVRPTKHARYSYIVRWPGPDGKRVAKLFSNETEALIWAKERKAELGDVGESFGSITEAERGAVMFWRSFVVTTPDAPADMLPILQEHAHRWRMTRASVTVSTALDRFLDQQEVDGASVRHLASLKSRLHAFAGSTWNPTTKKYEIGETGNKIVSSITTEFFTAWLNGLRATRADRVGNKLTLITRENLKRSCRTFFTYCQRSGWIEVNPVPIERKKRTREHRLANNKAPGILLPDQVALFMQAVKIHAPQLLAFWAVKFFAGIRDAEADRMTWDMIDLEAGEIHLPAGVTKTADQRTVKISDNLREWLKLGVRKTARIAASAKARQHPHKRVMKSLVTLHPETNEPVPFIFPSNAARHCFGTYHLYAHRAAGETALQLGHKGDPGMLHEHYKNPTAEKHAAAFWEIYPETKPKKRTAKPSNVVPIDQPTQATTSKSNRKTR